jgi:threonyl-tRNA synthetase
MKQYFVIHNDGRAIDAGQYLASSQGSSDFCQFVRLESEHRPDSGHQPGKPKYLDVARKFGFDWEANADAGLANYDYKASLIMALVKEYARLLVNRIGFPIFQVSGSNIFDLSYPVVEAYAGLYGDRLYRFKSGSKEVVMSYDASYPQFNLANRYSLSYRQLPFAHFSISDCYRHEQSGECMLLYRQRRFYMPDLHPYFRNVDEAFEWYPAIQRQLVDAARSVNRSYQVAIEVASPQAWQRYQSHLAQIAGQLDQDILVVVNDDDLDRYWIINADYKVIDKLSQSREICCIQIDEGNASRLGIHYVDQNGQKKPPIIIHAAVPGGIERFIYLMLDDFPDSFPLWLYPAQLRLLPVNQGHHPLCQRLLEELKPYPVRAEIDDRPESVGKKVKLCHQDLVPFSAVIGDKEAASGNLHDILGAQIQEIVAGSQGKPFLPLSYSPLVSLQPK